MRFGDSTTSNSGVNSIPLTTKGPNSMNPLRAFAVVSLSTACLSSLVTFGPSAVRADEPDSKLKVVAQAKRKVGAVRATAKPKFQYKSEGIEVPAASADEPKVDKFGPDTIRAAAKYLDDGSLSWVREKSCVACHSTGVYLTERSALTNLLGPPQAEVREQFIKTMPVDVGKPEIRNGSKYYGVSIQAVWRALGLASWDKFVTGKLSEPTDKALRQMLDCMADEGFIMTITQVEIPYITTDFELTTQAARAIATAPGWLTSLKDKASLKRIETMKAYLRDHRPINDYERAVKLQLATYMPDVVSKQERDEAIAMLRKHQKSDGGWSTRNMSDLMKWHVKMDPKVVDMIRSEPDAADPASDPFMTAFAIVLLREAGVPADDPQIRKGIDWLKSNQRVIGRWWMKSLYRDTVHYSTYISTAVALRALALCGEIPNLATDSKAE